jgi:hypothetical protein
LEDENKMKEILKPSAKSDSGYYEISTRNIATANFQNKKYEKFSRKMHPTLLPLMTLLKLGTL